MAVSEADDRYLAEIIADCELVLGPGIELLGLDRDEGDQGVQLVARYRLDGWEGETVVTGETVVAAHAALRPQLVSDRLRLGFSIMAESG
jgi:hypothetical protein